MTTETTTGTSISMTDGGGLNGGPVGEKRDEM